MPIIKGRVMAVDWGEARIGVALSDPTRTLATPLVTLSEKDKGLQIRKVAALAAEHEATLVLVGLPLHLDGRDSASTVTARKFAAKLALVIAPIPVELVDERLSSVEAAERLSETTRKKVDRLALDRAAAAVLLQGWLDVHGTRGETS